MIYNAKTVEDYLKLIPKERLKSFSKLRSIVLKNLPKQFVETISYGMIGYVVPHSIYPNGYHVNPKEPLPFMSIASQKNFIALYHLGIYIDKDLLNWFVENYKKVTKAKLDMGKSCIRFKNIDEIPFDLIGKLCKKISVKKFIESYEKAILLRNK